MGYEERIADPDDPLRTMLTVARLWRVPPTVFLRMRTVNSTEWTNEDTRLAMVLDGYESGLCPGGPHQLSETTKPEHENAYMGGERTRCHYCTASALQAEALEQEKGSSGLLTSIVLDQKVVELNRLPVPPLPPELAG